jgi:bacteriocin-like protein
MRALTETELKQVSGGAQPAQGSGKNPSGNKVDPFSGNPHDRPGANAKVTP